MDTRIAIALALVACSGGGGKDGNSPADTGSTTPGSSCPNQGALDGCLMYENDCTDHTNTDLSGLPGGWFNDDGGQLRIGHRQAWWRERDLRHAAKCRRAERRLRRVPPHARLPQRPSSNEARHRRREAPPSGST